MQNPYSSIGPYEFCETRKIENLVKGLYINSLEGMLRLGCFREIGYLVFASAAEWILNILTGSVLLPDFRFAGFRVAFFRLATFRRSPRRRWAFRRSTLPFRFDFTTGEGIARARAGKALT